MKLVNYDIHAPLDTVLESLHDNDRIVAEEKFDTSRGVPKIHIKQKGNKIKIKCEFTGRATKDNGFLEGTYLRGKLTEKDGVSSLKGIIITAPIYHTLLAILFAFFVIQCLSVGGFSPIPIILLVFSIFMFRDEFRKQRIIKRYVFRAFKNTFDKVNRKK